MPTYKHPCPYCGKFIERDVAACPYCGQAEPFSPKRCPSCHKIVDDPAWVVCPACGASLLVTTVPAGSGAAAPAQPAAETTPSSAPQPAPGQAAPAAKPAEAVAPTQGAKCGGCGAPLPPGARFCTVCGTVAG
jgi:RNA polymerase subunit RPABC4/transcription elongation factor Spt4